MANILLIDDEPLVLETLSKAMTEKGHLVVTATNGTEGMDKFGAGKFDLVITDIIMPEKEGIEFDHGDEATYSRGQNCGDFRRRPHGER